MIYKLLEIGIMKGNMTKKYNGDIVGGSLLVAESRKIAQLLLEDVSGDEWNKAIVIDNILQERSPAAAKRHARLIKKRLQKMTGELWNIVATGSSETATQALVAATIKDSFLLGDFLLNVIQQRWKMFERKLYKTDWNNYIEMCAQVDPGILEWSETTRKKTRQVVLRILAEAGYVDSTKTLNLQPVIINPEIEAYLRSHDENYVLQCIKATE